MTRESDLHARVAVLRALATCIAQDAGDVRIREAAPDPARPAAGRLRLEVEVEHDPFWRAVHQLVAVEPRP